MTVERDRFLMALSEQESRYVASLNAVLAARDDSPDVNRWRGMAEAYRAVCQSLRVALAVEPVDYRSDEWRYAHGVYSAERVAAMHR